MNQFDHLTQFFSRFPCPVVVLDLETTGGHNIHDRITEIAFLRFENGQCSSYSQLIHPQRSIPAFVSELTGINDELLKNQPIFSELAKDILPLLQGSLIIAHNSRFDYGFLCHEFARAGIDFATAAVCSVQLSRKLYPEYYKHSLDSIIERHQLVSEHRHRAMDDVMLLTHYLQIMLQEKGEQLWRQQAESLMNPLWLPEKMSISLREAIHCLPDSFGVTVWYDDAGHIIHHAVHEYAYREVAQKLKKNKKLCYAARLDWLPAVGLVHAFLLQAQLMRQHHLPFSEQIIRHTVQVYEDKTGCYKIRPYPLRSGWLSRPPYGLFAHPKAVKRTVLEWAKQFHLCPTLLNILPHDWVKTESCPVSLVHQCSEACETQNLALHNKAVDAALPFLPVSDWKKSKFLLNETHPVTGESVQFQCWNGAVGLGDGTFFISDDVIRLIKQKLRYTDHIEAWE